MEHLIEATTVDLQRPCATGEKDFNPTNILEEMFTPQDSGIFPFMINTLVGPLKSRSKTSKIWSIMLTA